MGFPGGSAVKKPPAKARDTRHAGLISGSRRSPGEENGNLLQYSCLENPIDRGVWRAKVHRIAKSQTGLKQLTVHACTQEICIGWIYKARTQHNIHIPTLLAEEAHFGDFQRQNQVQAVKVSEKTDFRSLGEELFKQSNMPASRIDYITLFSRRLFPSSPEDFVDTRSFQWQDCYRKNMILCLCIKKPCYYKEETELLSWYVVSVPCQAGSDWLGMSEKPHGWGRVPTAMAAMAVLLKQESRGVSDIYVFRQVDSALKHLIAVLQMYCMS